MSHLTDEAAKAIRDAALYGITPHKEWTTLYDSGMITIFGQLTEKGREWYEADFQRRLDKFNEEVGYNPEG